MSEIGRASLEAVLDRLGYTRAHRRTNVVPPGCTSGLDFVAYSQVDLHDLGTSAIAATIVESDRARSSALDLTRRTGAPIALLGSKPGIELVRIGATHDGDEQITVLTDPEDDPSDELVRSLGPRQLEEAKLGIRQLTLFPIDINVLEAARDASADSLSARVQAVFATAQRSGLLSPTEVAQAVAGALGVVIVRDKHKINLTTPAALLDSALQRYPSYFVSLSAVETRAPDLIANMIRDLSSGVDYAAIDARTVNRIYERLAVNQELRNSLGIFYTPPQLADRIVDMIPIEAIAPDDRQILDPACGSGNLLLATTDRLKRILPAGWDPTAAHNWLNTHVIGADVERVAVEIARLSFLVSSLPLGNNWQVERRDFLTDPPTTTPTIIVSNPPWHSPKGQRDEIANRFVIQSLNLLSSDGLLACVLPSTWLSSKTAATTRDRVLADCDIFEVWRLPRDVFTEARYSTSVLFARKTPVAKRGSYLYRWISPGRPSIDSFLKDGTSAYSAIPKVPATGNSNRLASSPLTSSQAKWETLSSTARLVSGVVQKGAGHFADAGKYRALPRNSPYKPYRPISESDIRWVNRGADFGAGDRDLDAFRSNQVLVQSSRNPDTAWRIRPVFDPFGVAPSNTWHAIVPHDSSHEEGLALLAALATSVASLWVHGLVATQNIPKWALESLPLPTPWNDWRHTYADLGQALVDNPSHEVLKRLETVAADAYDLTRKQRVAISQLMASSRAPEGGKRDLPQYLEGRQPAETGASAGRYEPASVLDVSGDRLRIWRLSGPEDGELTDPPKLLPGWCAVPGSSFEVSGAPLSEARYRLHRSAYVDEEVLFGVR